VCVVMALVTGSRTEATGGEKKKGKTNAGKIIGKWEVTKATKADFPPGFLIYEFTKDGKVKATFTKGDIKSAMEGTYKVEGDKLISKMKLGDKEISETNTIKTLNETMLILEDTQGEIVELKRKKK